MSAAPDGHAAFSVMSSEFVNPSITLVIFYIICSQPLVGHNLLSQMSVGYWLQLHRRPMSVSIMNVIFDAIASRLVVVWRFYKRLYSVGVIQVCCKQRLPCSHANDVLGVLQSIQRE